MKTASPKKRDFVAWAKGHPVPEPSVLAWGSPAASTPSTESLAAARHLLGHADEARLRTVAAHLDAIAELAGDSEPTSKRRAHGG